MGDKIKTTCGIVVGIISVTSASAIYGIALSGGLNSTGNVLGSSFELKTERQITTSKKKKSEADIKNVIWHCESAIFEDGISDNNYCVSDTGEIRFISDEESATINFVYDR